MVEGDPRDRLVEEFAGMVQVGVDISAEQLARARRNVPSAELIRARDGHARLFASARRWLRPGGVFLASLGSGDLPAWTGDWLGVPMFFSSHSATENRRLLDEAGLEAVHDEIVTMREPEGGATFHWVIRRNRGQTPNAGCAPSVALP